MLGTLLILVLGGHVAAATSLPIALAAVPVVVAPAVALTAAAFLPLLIPAPFALAAVPVLCVPALVAST
jgi:hypothetical protein